VWRQCCFSRLPESLLAETTQKRIAFASRCVITGAIRGSGGSWALNLASFRQSTPWAWRISHLTSDLHRVDALAYEFMAERFPEIANRLKPYLAAGKIELIGGTYGQPLGTMFSGESNIRQIVYGRNTILKALDYEMVTFLDEEEFSHPQIPQIVLGAGYRYASLSQVDTWGKAGVPHLEVNSFEWQGMDGSKVLSTPRNGLFGYSPDIKTLASSEDFKKLRAWVSLSSSLGRSLVGTTLKARLPRERTEI